MNSSLIYNKNNKMKMKIVILNQNKNYQILYKINIFQNKKYWNLINNGNKCKIN